MYSKIIHLFKKNEKKILSFDRPNKFRPYNKAVNFESVIFTFHSFGKRMFCTCFVNVMFSFSFDDDICIDNNSNDTKLHQNVDGTEAPVLTNGFRFKRYASIC